MKLVSKKTSSIFVCRCESVHDLQKPHSFHTNFKGAAVPTKERRIELRTEVLVVCVCLCVCVRDGPALALLSMGLALMSCLMLMCKHRCYTSPHTPYCANSRKLNHYPSTLSTPTLHAITHRTSRKGTFSIQTPAGVRGEHGEGSPREKKKHKVQIRLFPNALRARMMVVARLFPSR